ncbi:cupredoxin domain-containing protein [Ornithinicoccus halotolerans]|uniref:cupredoxin domain-containing protein n=1 Tax=Ornithinicoccus halotolerans TaxID=1748220 RepID=UPI0012980E6C|nr:cupredoxin domain-containing protein [Ornithinicoccus halotolerans]
MRLPRTTVAALAAAALVAGGCGGDGSGGGLYGGGGGGAPETSPTAAEEETTDGATGDETTDEATGDETAEDATATDEDATATDEDAAGAGEVVITISDFSYDVPDTVQPGAEITVRNEDTVGHTVTADDGASFDVAVGPGEEAIFTVPQEEGEYPFHCVPHPQMTDTLVVG